MVYQFRNLRFQSTYLVGNLPTLNGRILEPPGQRFTAWDGQRFNGVLPPVSGSLEQHAVFFVLRLDGSVRILIYQFTIREAG
jgi:hypothetical protein